MNFTKFPHAINLFHTLVVDQYGFISGWLCCFGGRLDDDQFIMLISRCRAGFSVLYATLYFTCSPPFSQCRPHGTRRRTATGHPPLTAPSCQQHPGRPVNPRLTGPGCPAARPTRPSWATCPMMSLRTPSKISSAAWQ